MFGRVAFWPRWTFPFRRVALAGAVLTGVAVALSACGGLFRMQQREPWRAEAEAQCLAETHIQASERVKVLPPIQRGVCGMDYPLQVTTLGDGQVALKGKLVLACPMLTTSDTWFREVVQPAAELILGTQVIAVNAGSYSCRTMNNQPGAKTSEHAYGNALDVMGFKLADGRDLTVVKGWKGQPEEQDFLREVFVGACRYFGTVLGPGSNVYHYDHIHMDLARHNPAGTRRICQPLIKYTPRLDPDRPATPVRRPPAAPLPPLGTPQDIDNDPGVSDDEMAQNRDVVPLAPATAVAVAPARPVSSGAVYAQPLEPAPAYRPPVAASLGPSQLAPPERPLAPPTRSAYADPDRPVPPMPIPQPGRYGVPPGSLGVLREPAPGPAPRPYASGAPAGGAPLDLHGPGGTGAGIY